MIAPVPIPLDITTEAILVLKTELLKMAVATDEGGVYIGGST